MLPEHEPVFTDVDVSWNEIAIVARFCCGPMNDAFGGRPACVHFWHKDARCDNCGKFLPCRIVVYLNMNRGLNVDVSKRGCGCGATPTFVETKA